MVAQDGAQAAVFGAVVRRVAGAGEDEFPPWGGNVGFAVAPFLVTAVVGTGGLRLSPLLFLPALVGSVLTLPVLRALDRDRVSRACGGRGAAQGRDD